MMVGETGTSIGVGSQAPMLPAESASIRSQGRSDTPEIEHLRYSMQQEIENLAADLKTLQSSKWVLANLDFIREDATKQVGAEQAERIVAAQKEHAEGWIKMMDQRLTALPQALSSTYSISGNLVAKDSNGDWTLGEFSITGTGKADGRAFSVTLDSRTGFSITAGGTTTTDPAAAAAIALLRDGISDGARLVDQRV
jgi:hypothetical protein